MATARKRLELQIHQQEQAVTRLGEQRIKDLQAGRSDLAAEVGTRLPVVGAQLADLRNQYANVRSEEERLTVASRRLQHKVDDFRTRKDAAKAAEAAAAAAARAAEAEADIEGVIAHAEDPDHDAMPSHGRPAPSAWLSLSELRPGAAGPHPVHRGALELRDGAVRYGRPARRRDRTRLAGRLVHRGDTPIPDPVRAGPGRYRLTSRSA